MPAPLTIVTFADEDGDEFPVRLPGAYYINRSDDIVWALQIAGEMIRAGDVAPRGALKFDRIEYI